MRKFADYNHLSRCEIGTWQGIIRNTEYNVAVPYALEYLEDAMFQQDRSKGHKAVVYAYHLADFLFHKISFPENKSRRVRAIKNKLKPPRRRYIPYEWLNSKRKDITDMMTLLKYPLREEGENKVDAGPFTLTNPINLSDDKVQEMVSICNKALRLCTDSLAPSFAQVLYGDVVLVEKLGRAKWYASYSSSKDEITMKYMGRDSKEFLKTFIHELGHRYYKKILPSEKKQLWRIYDNECHFAQRINLSEWIGKDIGLYATKRRTRTAISSEGDQKAYIFEIDHRGVYLKLEDGEVLGTYSEKFLKNFIRAKTGIFPTQYALSDAEEHFCEALSYKAVGELHPKSLDAFNSIIMDGVAYEPDASNFTSIFEKTEETGVRTQVEKTLPSKEQMIELSEGLARRLGVSFKKQRRKYGLFVYTNEAVGSTHSYMFIDYATGNLFLPKTKSQPNLNVNLANILDEDVDRKSAFERMSNLRPRWRTMNTITDPTMDASSSEVADQTPEPSIPTSPEGNLVAIKLASQLLARALGVEYQELRKVIRLIYKNYEGGTDHAYLFIDKQSGSIYPPKASNYPKKKMLLGSILEPNIIKKVNFYAMQGINPKWRNKFVIKG